MSRPCILITGAAGEVGHSLVEFFCKENKYRVIAFDFRSIPAPKIPQEDLLLVQGDITNKEQVNDLFAKHEIHQVFHLAAILSSGGERNPEKTHQVNVEGSLNLLVASQMHGEKIKRSVIFMYPSTMAVHGIKTLAAKNATIKIQEDEFLSPITIYGANKLYVENLGRYYSNHYKLLDDTPLEYKVDFRAVRFPGLMSSETLPTGGTSDYGSEMIHAAAQNKPYACFVSPKAKLPFMAMPDGISALINLSKAPKASLTQCVYNVSAFAVTAEEIQKELQNTFPNCEIFYEPNRKREQIVDTWPGDIDDSAARKDWGWKNKYDFHSAFSDYLIPGITKKYHSK